jgi:Zn-dependent protease/CBS domain-containing protein
MSPSLRLGRIAGVEIGLNWSWLVVFALLVWTLARGVFPLTNPHLSSGTHLAMAVVATAAFFCSLLLHELGHALQARREGVRIEGITLWLFGGVARFKGAFPSAGAELRVAIAGPLVTLGLGGLFIGVSLAGLPQAVHGVLAWLGYINLVLLVFNLLPALPLDGGRVLRSVLWQIKGDLVAATRIAADVARGFAYLFISVGVVLFIFQGLFSGAWLAFIGWFLLQAASAEARYVLARQALDGFRVRDLMTPDPVTVAPDLTLGRFMDEVVWEQRHTTYPVVEDDQPVGLLPFRRVAEVPRREWDDKHVRDCMVEPEQVPQLQQDEPAIDALGEFGEASVNRALVLSDGRLVGLLSKSDLSRALQAPPRRRTRRHRRATR